MTDVRTPTTYFQQQGASKEALVKLKGKLDDLLASLYALRDKSDKTPATEKIVDDEITKAEEERYRQVSKQNASRVVEALVHGTADEAADAIGEALDWKWLNRTEPYLMKAGVDIEEQIFWLDQYGNK